MMNNMPVNNTRLSELANNDAAPIHMAAAGRYQTQPEQGMLPSARDAIRYQEAYKSYALQTMEAGEQPMPLEEFATLMQSQGQ